MPDFSVEAYLPPNRTDVGVIRLQGSLDSYSLNGLEKKIREMVDSKRYYLVINCKKLKFLSSPGMGLFLGALGDVEKQGGGLVFAEVTQPEVHDAMNLLGFFDIFSLYEQEKEAIESIGKS